MMSLALRKVKCGGHFEWQEKYGMSDNDKNDLFYVCSLIEPKKLKHSVRHLGSAEIESEIQRNVM